MAADLQVHVPGTFGCEATGLGIKGKWVDLVIDFLDSHMESSCAWLAFNWQYNTQPF